jgi:hypothetical protein
VIEGLESQRFTGTCTIGCEHLGTVRVGPYSTPIPPSPDGLFDPAAVPVLNAGMPLREVPGYNWCVGAKSEPGRARPSSRHPRFTFGNSQGSTNGTRELGSRTGYKKAYADPASLLSPVRSGGCVKHGRERGRRHGAVGLPWPCSGQAQRHAWNDGSNGHGWRDVSSFSLASVPTRRGVVAQQVSSDLGWSCGTRVRGLCVLNVTSPGWLLFMKAMAIAGFVSRSCRTADSRPARRRP